MNLKNKEHIKGYTISKIKNIIHQVIYIYIYTHLQWDYQNQV